MRVASRRVQAVMKVFRAAFPKGEFRKQYKVIRGIKDVLGVVRHYDVFIDGLEKYVKELPATEKAALELLIIRERALREKERKEMVRFVRGLKRKEYKEKFLEFAGKT
jgi:CHAD domain-containing protein